jgi:hypothetical protein
LLSSSSKANGLPLITEGAEKLLYYAYSLAPFSCEVLFCLKCCNSLGMIEKIKIFGSK